MLMLTVPTSPVATAERQMHEAIEALSDAYRATGRYGSRLVLLEADPMIVTAAVVAHRLVGEATVILHEAIVADEAIGAAA